MAAGRAIQRRGKAATRRCAMGCVAGGRRQVPGKRCLTQLSSCDPTLLGHNCLPIIPHSASQPLATQNTGLAMSDLPVSDLSRDMFNMTIVHNVSLCWSRPVPRPFNCPEPSLVSSLQMLRAFKRAFKCLGSLRGPSLCVPTACKC
eukprot:60101-Chlamydomonas_euryale.AAC.2